MARISQNTIAEAAAAAATADTLAASTTIGDASAEDTKIVFDGNAQDFHIGLDDTADDLVIGLGSTLGTTTHMSFDENGIISMPLQSFASVHLNGSQTVAHATATIMAFALEISDINADFNTGTNRYVCPVDGVYLIKANISPIIADQIAIFTFIHVNGSEIFRDGYAGSGSNRWGCQAAGIAKLDASDYIEIVAYQGSGGDLVYAGSSSPSYTNAQFIKLA